MKLKKIGLIVGCSYSDKGAYNYNETITEYDYWKQVAYRVLNDYPREKLIAVGLQDKEGLQGAIEEIKKNLKGKPDLLIKFRFNTSENLKEGCEVYYCKSDLYAKKFCDFMEFKKRVVIGEKPSSENFVIDENLKLMSKHSKNSILVKPFYGDNKKDFISIDIMTNYLKEFFRIV